MESLLTLPLSLAGLDTSRIVDGKERANPQFPRVGQRVVFRLFSYRSEGF